MGIGNDFLGDVEELLTVRAIRRGSLFRMTGAASHCWRAEKEIEQMYEGMRCLLLPSASVGLSLLLEVLNLPPGGEVLIAPFGWVSNWSCIQRAGLTPRFMPLDEGLQLDPREVAARIGPRTGAVIVTHLMGRGQQAVHEIAALCADRGIPMLEDVAQSFGASIGGRRAGTFGAGAWCSLNHHKVLSTGDGGFVLVRDEMMFAGVSARHDQGNVMRNGKRRQREQAEPGLSLRVNELTAAVLRAQMARFHFLRARILAIHEALSGECRRTLNVEMLLPASGDLPFTVLFRRPPAMRYPSLAESGAHVAPSVPWLAQAYATAVREDPAVGTTIEHLAGIGAIGAGFVDPYYAILAGVGMTESLDRIPAVVGALREAL